MVKGLNFEAAISTSALMLSKLLSNIFGTKSGRDIKVIMPYVEKTKEEFSRLSALSDDQLRGRTDEIRSVIDERLRSIDDQLGGLHALISDNPEMELNEKESIFNQIDKLEEERNKELEVVLLEVLPQAFAVVKETARRLKENRQLVVEATLQDRQLAVGHDFVRIEGDKAIWLAEWTAASNKIRWDMVHYDVQLIGGVVLHQ